MFKRGICIGLTLLLLLTGLPFNTLAAGTDSSGVSQQLSAHPMPPQQTEQRAVPEAALLKSGKSFSIQSTRQITEVLQPPKKTVDYSAATVADILPSLPSQVAVTLSDGSRILLDVEWNMGNLAFETDWDTWETKATISGSLILPNGITNPNSLQVSLTLVQNSIYTTPNGYADADFQKLYLFMSRFLSGETNANGLPVYLPPEQWTPVTWVTKEVQGVPAKFVQSINLDDLTSKMDASEWTPQLDNLVGLNELTTFSCQNSGMTFLHIYECPKLTTLDCSNNQITRLNLGYCPSLTLLDCANNALSFSRMPAKADLPAGCDYIYAPQTNLPEGGEGPGTPLFSLSLDGLTENLGEGYYLTTNIYLHDDDPYPFDAPYTTTWVDQNGDIVPYQRMQDYDPYTDYIFVSAADGSGKTLHRVINNSDFPSLSEISPEITLPIYGLQIRSIALTPQSGGWVSSEIDYANHRVNIYPEGVSDFTNIEYTLAIASGSTASLSLNGTFDISTDIPLTIYDSEGHQQQWTIGREPNAETGIHSFKLTEDPEARVEIHSGISAIYVGLSSQSIPLNSLTPAIVTSAGGTVAPASGVAQDFSQPVSYTVTSETGSDARVWKVYVVYLEGDCTCAKSKLTLPGKIIPMQPIWPQETYGGGSWISLVNMLEGSGFTGDLSLERYPCFQPGHADGQPTYSYRIGSTNECGASWTKTFTTPSFPAVSFLNPGRFSLIATAELNGETIETEAQFEIQPYADNFKLLTTSLDVNVGDTVTVKWNDDSLSTHPTNSYTLYYSEDITPGSWKEEVCTVTGVSEATFTWTKYQGGYISVRKNLPDGSCLICSAPVQIANMKLSVDITLPKFTYGDTGCFDNKDYVIDYKITGQDLAKYQDQIKLYTEISYQGGPGQSIPFTDYEVTDSQIILHHESYPQYDLSDGVPRFYLKVTVSNLDGSFVHDELANYSHFYIYQLPAWAKNAAVYDYKNRILDADHPLLLGPGFLDLSTLTIADVLKDEDNPILYTSGFAVKDLVDGYEQMGSGFDYQISDESVAEFEYQTSYATDGTAIKFPRAIVAKKDGECTVTIKDDYTGLVLTFPVKVSLAKDTLVWFKVINGNKYWYPFSNFINYVGVDGIIANPIVAYVTKTGARKTVTGDAQGNVLIYDPDGLTGEVEVKTPLPDNPLKYYWYSGKLEMSTVFKSTAWGSKDFLIRDGMAPRYQMLPAYLADLYTDPTMNFMLKPNEDLMKFTGFADYGHFSNAALEHIQAKVYVLNAAGEEVFAAPAGSYHGFLQVTWDDAAKTALLDDQARVLVEMVPLTEEPGTLSYSIVGTDREYGAVPVIAADGKTMTFAPNEFDSWGQFVHITVRATNKQTGKTFDFVVEVSAFYQIDPRDYPYPHVTVGGTYTLDLDTVFTRPVIQSTIFERTAAELRQSSERCNGNVNVDVPVNVGRKNGVENTVASLLLVEQNGNLQEASSRTTPLGITPDKPITMISYLKSTAEDALSGNDYTIEAYKNTDLLEQEWQKSYYLGSGDSKMKYKWYVNAIKLDTNLVPPTDYFKPKYQILKDDGSTETVTAKFEAVNPDGLVPDPKPPTNLPFTGSLSSGAFNTGVMGKGSLPFDLPSNFSVDVQYDFSQGNLEGTFKMLVGYGRGTDSQSGDRFASDYSEAVSAIGNIRYGGVSKGGKASLDFTVVGYVDGIVRYVDGNYKMIATGGGIIASAAFEYSWCQNAVVGFIPVYYGIDIGASLSVDASINAYNFDDDQAINGDYEIAYKAIVEIAGYVKISGGIGFDVGIVAAKIGAFGQLDLSYKIGIIYASGDTSTGGKFTFRGTIGIEAIVKFLWWKKRYVFCDAGFTYTYTHGDQTVFDDDDDEAGFAASGMSIMNILPMSDYNPKGKPTGRYVLLDTGYEMEDRDYLESPQRWNGDKNMLGMMAAVDLGTTTKSLLTNAYPYAYPILARDGGTMLMLSDMGSTDIDDTAVVYSQKGSDGLWSAQQKIDPAETTAASNLSYDGSSGFALAAWENVNVNATDEDDIGEMADKAEIKAAVFNGSNWTASMITNNSLPDMGPTVAVNGERGVLLWQRTTQSYGDSDPLAGEAPSELWLKTYAGGSWSNEIKLPIPAVQVIKSYKAAIMSDGTVMVVYSYEKPGSAGGDIAGREIGRLIISPNGTASGVVSCTSDSDSDTNPQIMAKKLTIGGVEKEYFYVAWYNQQASVDSQGNTVMKKDILIRTYDGSNEEVQILPASLNANRVSDDPELTENFSFIRSESLNPQDFGISWLLPYSLSDNTEAGAASEYGVYAKLFANNNSRLLLTAPIKAALVNPQDAISAFSTVVTRSGDDETLNVVYAKAHYSTDEAAPEPEEIFTPGQTDLYWATTVIKNTIHVDEVNFDRQGVFANTPTNISFTITNKGIKEIQSVKLSTGSQTFTKTVKILPNSSQPVSVLYLNGAMIVSPVFSITPIFTDSSEGETTTATANLGVCDLEIVDIVQSNAGANGDFNFDITVRNNSRFAMAANNIALDLGIYEDVSRTARASVFGELGAADIQTITDANLDNGNVVYRLSYHVNPEDYNADGLKLLYVTLQAKDGSGSILQELSYENNDGIIEFTDPNLLYKDQFNLQLAVAKDKEGKGAAVTSMIENLHTTEATNRLLLLSTDEQNNLTETQAVLFTLNGGESSDPLASRFDYFGKRVDYKFLAPEKLGFTFSKQDASPSVPGKITAAGFGGSGNYEYSLDNGQTWQEENLFDGLNEGRYVLCVRDKNNSSLVSEAEDIVLYLEENKIYTVSIGELSGGEITADPASAAAGITITLTVTPDNGMRLKEETLKYNDGTNDVAITGLSFTMPAVNVIVAAEFEADEQSVLQFAGNGAMVDEAAGSISVEVLRSGNIGEAVSVDYSTVDDSAVQGADYTAVSGTLAFAPEETSKTIMIPLIDDSDYEPTESFYLKLENPGAGAKIGENKQTAVTIEENDYLENTGVIIYNVFEGGFFGIAGDDGRNYRPVKALRNVRAGDRVRFEWLEADAEAAGEISYQMWGKTIRLIRIEVIGSVNQLQDGNGSSQDPVPDDTGSEPEIPAPERPVPKRPGNSVVQFGQDSYKVREASLEVTLTVIRTGSLESPCRVEYAVTPLTAEDGIDYINSSGVLMFGGGEDKKEIVVKIIRDNEQESTEQFEVKLMRPTRGISLGAFNKAVVEIESDIRRVFR